MKVQQMEMKPPVVECESSTLSVLLDLNSFNVSCDVRVFVRCWSFFPDAELM